MSVFVWLLMTLRGWVRSRAALHLEVLALRHQLQALERSRPRRLRLTRADCVLWTWVSRAWNGWRAALVIVKPQTLIAWHRQAFGVLERWPQSMAKRKATLPTHSLKKIFVQLLCNPTDDLPI